MMSSKDSLDSVITNMSREDLVNEIVNLKSISTSQLKKADDYEQKLYELKRQLSTSKALVEHLTSEIESLQKNDTSEVQELAKKISCLEHEIRSLKQSNVETAQYYESELQNKNIEINNLIDSTKSKLDSNAEQKSEEIYKCSEEICNLKLKNNELTEQLLEFETKYQELILKNSSLENKISYMSNDLEELRKCLEIKNEELQESKELSQNLQDEILEMQIEIDKFRTVSLEKAAKGNSLFAEVDDNRVKLQKHMEIMKQKYVDIKTQYTNKCHEFTKLHMEYATLIQTIENKNDLSEEQSELEETYKRHIDSLNETIKSLENELKLQKNAFSEIIAKDWKCVQDMITASRDEVLSLQKKLNAESLGVLISETNHFNTKRERKMWHAKAMKLQAQNLSLNQTIEELKLMKSPTIVTTQSPNMCAKENPFENDISLLTQIENFDLNVSKNICSDLSLLGSDKSEVKRNDQNQEGDKENINSEKVDIITKKVSFDTSIAESKKTGRIGGRKMINVQPIHIPSIKKN